MAARTRVGAIVLVAAMGASVAACGGGSKALSKADLDTKANAICTTAAAKVKAVPAISATDLQDATKAAAYFDKIVPIISNAADQIGALKPDDAAKTDWNAFVTATKAATNLLKTIQHKADTKDPSGLADVQQYQTLDTTANAAAVKAGATACGNN